MSRIYLVGKNLMARRGKLAEFQSIPVTKSRINQQNSLKLTLEAFLLLLSHQFKLFRQIWRGKNAVTGKGNLQLPEIRVFKGNQSATVDVEGQEWCIALKEELLRY